MERPHTLLLVEDEQLLRSLIAQFLRGHGLRVVEAADGIEALRQLDDAGPFDLVMTDLNLPSLSGVDVVRALRASHTPAPVIVCSAAVSADAERTLRELGVQEFLGKPFHPELLLQKVEQLVFGPRRNWLAGVA